MSNIGRRPIDISGVTVEIKGNDVHYKGSNDSGVYNLPDFLKATVEDKKLMLEIDPSISAAAARRKYKKFWGLHAALLANRIKGAGNGFTKSIIIKGLGYKAVLAGNKIVMTLGYSHKIDVPMPKGVSLEIDKSGQNLTFKSASKAALGEICDVVRSLRPPEPYKGTGVMYADEHIIRKAGKAKAS